MTGQSTQGRRPDANALAEKARYNPTIDTEAMFARAEQALSELKWDYLGVVDPEADKLARICRGIRSDPTDYKTALADLHAISFELKGQAGTFGYGLITDIGESLCRFINTIDTPTGCQLDVVLVHVDALRLVIRERLHGDGGAAGCQLLEDLQAAVDKVTA